MSEPLSPLARAAVAYAAAGYPVFPSVPCGKKPRIKYGFKAASTNSRRVANWWREWPDANIGIATGGSGYEVLDIDVHDNGYPGDGYASFEKAWNAGLARGWTHLVRTPSGGLHVYYRANPDRRQPCWSIPEAHLDFRGTGGYIIAPPSHTCIDGIHGIYEIVARGTVERPIDAQRVRDLFRPPPPSRPPVDPARFAADCSQERLAAWVASQKQGNRRRGLLWAACRYAEHGLSEAHAHAVLGEAARLTGLSEKEIRDAVGWAYRNAHPAMRRAEPTPIGDRPMSRITARGQHRVIDLHRHTNGDGRGDKREAARQVYRDSVAAGSPLGGRELATRFGYSRSWGRDRIREVIAESTRAAPAISGTFTSHETDTMTSEPRPPVVQHPIGGERPAVVETGRAEARSGRRVAWLAFVVGVAASVAANVMHAQMVSATPAAWIGAAFWPIGLLLAIEVLARVSWPQGSAWHRLAPYAGTGMVAIVAAILSYRHMAGLLASWGEDSLSAYLGPLAVDGLMILAAAALLTRRPAAADEHDEQTS